MAVNILLKRSATASKRPVGASMAFGELNLNYDAATGGLYYKDSAGSVVKVGPCQVSATAPNSSPAGSSGNSAGEFWFDTATQTLKLYDGTAWVEAGGSVQGVTGTAPITVDNTDPLNPVVGITTGTTSARGAVQLTDSTSSTSTTTAATPNSVKSAYDLAAAALPKSGGTMTGSVTFNAGQVFPGVVTSVTAAGGSVISVDNTDPTQPVLSVASSSTTSPGVVQLNDTTSSSSVTEALTANQGRVLQTQIDALVVSSNLTFAGTIDASTGDMVTVSTEGAAAGFTIGNPLPSPVAGNSEHFVIVTVPGTMTPPGGSVQECHQGDWWLSDGTVWNFLDVGYNAPYATTATPGVVQLATDAEVQAGVNLDHAVTPAGLQSKVSNSVTTTSDITLASSTAAKTAYDAGIQGQTDAAAAQATADDAMPKSGGTFTNSVTFSAGPGLGIITSFGTIVPGSGYTPGTYTGVELTGGSGVAAIVDITVGPSGEVTNVDLIDGGIDYTVGNVLTAIIPGGGAGWSIPVATTSPPVGVPITIDNPSTLAVNGFAVFNNQTTFNDYMNISGNVGFADTSQTYFDPGSTIGFNGSAEVNGTFTFNTPPVFPTGVDIGAAAQVTYNNTTSGLSAANVQTAIDEIVDEYIPNASFTAAGDLLVGTGAGTYSSLSAGAADYILSSDGAGSLVWVPQSEGDVTGVTGTSPITVDNTDPQNPVIGINAASTSAAGAVQLNDTVASTSATQAATANAAKTAYDAAIAAQSTANAALPKAGGTMTGNIVFQDAGEGIQFNGGSALYAISDSVTTASSTTAASSAAVKAAYDAAIAAQTSGPLTSDTVLYVNSTDGNDSTAARGTDKPYATITAALAAASDGDTIFLSAGTFTENFTISKGVHLAGVFCDQATWSGTKILGNVTINLAGGVTRNLAISDIYFISANSTSPVSVTGMSPGAGGINTITGCMFTQQTVTDTNQFAFQTSGTWTRSLYLRECTIDGNFKHNAGTAAGASGYIVIDQLLGVGNSSMYHYILTGTVEYRNPSNSLASIYQTGGVVLVNNASAGITPNSATTTAVFGGTGFSYKGTAASVGTGTVYFQGGDNQGSGKVDIGANVVYGWSSLTIDPANLTVNGAAVAYTTAVPTAANAQKISQQRPRLDLLKSTSSVTAANQLATVIDSSTGALYTVASMDAGTY